MKNPYLACSFFSSFVQSPGDCTDCSKYEVLLYLIILWTYTCWALVSEYQTDLRMCFMQQEIKFTEVWDIFFCLTSRIKCSNFSLLKILFNTFQIKRLDLCQKLLVSLKMTGYLNDNALSLQCIVQIYGLLCPIIYWQLPVSPVLQVKYFSN